VLDLAPLELDCMNMLWPLGEATVRDIRDALAEKRPRAYTTIMTIMDRLARKGIVERRRVGRAYIYRPNLSCEDARAQALGQIIENFFGGSREALLMELGAVTSVTAPRARAAAAGAGAGASSAIASVASRGGLEVVSSKPALAEPLQMPPQVSTLPDGNSREAADNDSERIDDTLL
jgi:predicted transcriptional regulator